MLIHPTRFFVPMNRDSRMTFPCSGVPELEGFIRIPSSYHLWRESVHSDAESERVASHEMKVYPSGCPTFLKSTKA